MRFILIGTLNALITVLIVWLMMDKLGCNYIATNITAYVIAQINNFFWSKYWIFSSHTGKFRREIPLFLIAFGCAYCAQFFALLIMVEIFRPERIPRPVPRTFHLWSCQLCDEQENHFPIDSRQLMICVKCVV